MGMVGLRDVLVVAPAGSFHPHHHHHHHESLLPSGDHPIIPLLAATPCQLVDDPHVASAKPFWQPQPPHPQHHPPLSNLNPNPNPNPNNNCSTSLSYLKKPVTLLDAGAGGPSTCQDCGNQAKKDCSHRRCRTCCKSRGFDCSTHVKSTWVPAARRRERQQLNTAGSSASTSAPKKPRLLSSQTTTTATTASHTSTSNTTPPRSFDTSSSHQDAGFRDSLPRHVKAPAVFKCVRVTSIDDGEDEYAYHAMVRIGGHVFKGFLYDHGIDDGHGDHTSVNTGATTTGNNNNTNNNNSTVMPNISELHLGGGGRNGHGTSSSSAMLPASDVYGGGASGAGGLFGGTAYGNTIS